MNIQIYIICFNNGFYIENTLRQLKAKNIPNNQINIINNNSNGKETLEILSKISTSYNVINLSENYGHKVWCHQIIWNILPEYFIITDPDLEYNIDLPNDFINTLYEISNLYNASKVGFALDIKNEDIFDSSYVNDMSIKDWERQFWEKQLPEYKSLELYKSDIDTTFFLGCKSRMNNGYSLNLNIRVGSVFTCKHLPWHISHINSLSKDRILEMYLNNNGSSTIAKIIKNYINY
jgi:hypothetical protein